MSTSPSSSPRRILITGATGFIGRYLVEEAQKAGLEVWIAIRPESNRRKAEALGARLVALDYADEAGMTETIRQTAGELAGKPWHYVIHNAGLTKTARVQEFYQANAEHTKRLCSALYAAGAIPERFVLISSLSSYGAPTASDGVLRASDPQHPTTHYGRSKLLAEQYVQTSGLPWSILLPTGVYGPGDADYLMALESIQRGINFMAGLEEQHLTFVYGQDVARAALLVAQHPQAEGQSYIVADGDTHTDTAFGQLAKELLGRKALNLRAPLPLLYLICSIGSLWAKLTGRVTPLNSDKYRIMAQRSWRCDTAPLLALGWRPLYDLRRGLEATISAARQEGRL